MTILQQLSQAITILNTRDQARRAELQARNDLTPEEIDWLDQGGNYTELAELIEVLELEDEPEAVFQAMQDAGEVSAVDAALQEAAAILASESYTQLSS